MRHKVIETRQEIFNHNEHEVSKRWAFEEGVSSFFFFKCLLAKFAAFLLICTHFESYVRNVASF